MEIMRRHLAPRLYVRLWPHRYLVFIAIWFIERRARCFSRNSDILTCKSTILSLLYDTMITYVFENIYLFTTK